MEAQQEQQRKLAEAAAPKSSVQSDAAAVTKAAEADRKRRVQALEMQRERILSERTSSAHRRTALAAALADIEEKLVELGWTLHL